MGIRQGRLLFYKCGLAPVLKLQATHLRRNAVRLPEPDGLREGTVGTDENQVGLGVLVVGDSSAASVGVAHQKDGLAFQIASQISARIGRRVQWQLVAKNGTTTESVNGLLEAHTLRPAEVLVLCLGGNDVFRQRRPQEFIDAYRNLIQKLSSSVRAKLVIINGLPPVHVLPAMPQPLRWYLGKYAHRLDGYLREFAASEPHFRYVSLQWAAVPADLASDRFHPSKKQYIEWGRRVADCVESWMQTHSTLENPA